MRKTVIAYITIFTTMIFSCKENSSQNPNAQNNSDSLQGNYHFLEDTGTKIFLPTDYKRYSLVQYQALLNSQAKKNGYDIATPRIENLGKMEGSLYIFYNESNDATYTVNTIPYYEFTKDDGQLLLGLITDTHQQIKKKNEVTFTKVTARTGGNINQQIFKAIYKVNGKKIKKELIQTSYIISAKEKTVFINLNRDFEGDFDPYIEKMVIK